MTIQKNLVIMSLTDLVDDFLYEDRAVKAIEAGEVTAEELTAEFKRILNLKLLEKDRRAKKA